MQYRICQTFQKLRIGLLMHFFYLNYLLAHQEIKINKLKKKMRDSSCGFYHIPLSVATYSSSRCHCLIISLYDMKSMTDLRECF